MQALFRLPPTQSLTAQEMDLVWKFRFYLTRDQRVASGDFGVRVSPAHHAYVPAPKFLRP